MVILNRVILLAVLTWVSFLFVSTIKKKVPAAQEIPHNNKVKPNLDPQKQTKKEGRKRIYQGKYKKNKEFPGAVAAHGFPYRIPQGIPFVLNHFPSGYGIAGAPRAGGPEG
jgi:hypothetical protein